MPLPTRKLPVLTFWDPTDRVSVMRKQLSYFLARSQVPLHWVHSNGDEPDRVVPEEGDCPDVPPPTQPDDIVAALGNQSLSKHFRNFGKAVGVSEPKSVEDIYKLHLEAGRAGTTGAGAMNSHRENLATTYVNAFVNAGFGNDKLLVEAAEGQSWIYKNKDTGMKAATASIGLSLLWDGESGIDQIDKYSYSSEEEIKAGALLATGILHAGIRGEPDLAWALLEDHIQSQSKSLKIAAMMGTAVSHANWRREDIATVMLGHIAEESSLEISAMAALTCGFTYVGSGDGEIASTILQSLMEWEEKDLDSEWSIFYSVALGLVFLGKFFPSLPRHELMIRCPGPRRSYNRNSTCY
jgi:26S proteasome regulatory subunit N1